MHSTPSSSPGTCLHVILVIVADLGPKRVTQQISQPNAHMLIWMIYIPNWTLNRHVSCSRWSQLCSRLKGEWSARCTVYSSVLNRLSTFTASVWRCLCLGVHASAWEGGLGGGGGISRGLACGGSCSVSLLERRARFAAACNKKEHAIVSPSSDYSTLEVSRQCSSRSAVTPHCYQALTASQGSAGLTTA